jgi:transcriptional regulator GlxA family with amidase domain
LAEAGLLHGRSATTHWQLAAELQDRFPQIKVQQDQIFIRDGAVWTSAGMTAGIDLSVALVQDELGADVSRSVAEKLLVDHYRMGGQSQYSSLRELEPKSHRIQLVLTYAKANLNKSLPIGELAEVAGLSPRQFSRVFKAETAQSPAQAIEGLRVQAARALIDADDHTLAAVAMETGFIDPERMRRAFLRIVGHPPQTIRRFAKEHAARDRP